MKNLLIITSIVLFIALLLGIIFYHNLANFIMILSIFIFGLISHYAKHREEKIISLVLLLLLSLSNIYINGIRWGIDFKGGSRIPITLEKSVDTEVMQEIVQKIKSRASSLGMEQVVVKAIGNNLIYVEIPSQDEKLLNKIQNIITKQGVFIGVVDGEIVLEGRDILPGSIVPVSNPQALGGADWGVQFSINRKAAERFAEKVRGKAGYPVYMFLDRPSNAIIVLKKDKLLSLLEEQQIDYADFVIASSEVLEIKDLGSIELVFEEELSLNYTNKTIILSNMTDPSIIKELSKNNEIILVGEDQLYPKLIKLPNGNVMIESWKAIGLISSPRLSPSVTEGRVLLTYVISGTAEGRGTEKIKNAEEERNTIITVLKGGAFPVKLEAGSITTIPPTLGERFLNYSVIALFISLITVSTFVSLRYRKLKIIIPMLIITIVEAIILISLVGSFTIDLAAMAGIIASIGVSIDAQIVITDEILKAQKKETKKALKQAFEIINNNALVAIAALLPLFFVGVVEIIGFAISAMFAYILGVLISRPSYAAIIEMLVDI